MAISTFGYKRSKRQLSITFVNGKTHVYAGVPPKVYEQLVAATSKGEFFNAHIRDQYQHAVAA